VRLGTRGEYEPEDAHDLPRGPVVIALVSGPLSCSCLQNIATRIDLFLGGSLLSFARSLTLHQIIGTVNAKI
jgi:hypothetical protein